MRTNGRGIPAHEQLDGRAASRHTTAPSTGLHAAARTIGNVTKPTILSRHNELTRCRIYGDSGEERQGGPCPLDRRIYGSRGQ